MCRAVKCLMQPGNSQWIKGSIMEAVDSVLGKDSGKAWLLEGLGDIASECSRIVKHSDSRFSLSDVA
jgi:hypothetical protein